MDAKQLPVGAEVMVDGRLMRHLGGGQFEPVGKPMAKRFDQYDGEPLQRPLPQGGPLCS